MARRGRLQRILGFFTSGGGLTPPDGESWAIGDMAECMFAGPWFHAVGNIVHEPQRGHVGIVREVRLARGPNGAVGLYLNFARWPLKCFDATAFRKLTPRADAASAADADFLTLVKPAPAPEPIPVHSIAARLKRILS